METDYGKEYMRAYWAKNLYRFAMHTTMGFDLEGKRTLPDSYAALIPPGYEIDDGRYDIIFTNTSDFWR